MTQYLSTILGTLRDVRTRNISARSALRRRLRRIRSVYSSCLGCSHGADTEPVSEEPNRSSFIHTERNEAVTTVHAVVGGLSPSPGATRA